MSKRWKIDCIDFIDGETASVTLISPEGEVFVGLVNKSED